jgi:4-hydroxy-tetrahydrodipicolinate synthase
MARLMTEPIRGVYAAVLFARNERGRLDEAAFAKQLEFSLDRGIRNFALNGATGEFCLTTQEDLRRALRVASSLLPSSARLLCGVGAAGAAESIALARICFEAGAEAVLLPMPYFFPYEQDDLAEFVCKLDSELAAPILLYNLPRFTTGLEPETVVKLVRDCPHVIGVKDSSGSLTILRHLTQSGLPSVRIVGSDTVLAQALVEGICDCVVSGVACVLPELIQALFTHKPGSEQFDNATIRLGEFVAKIETLPVPWGLKAIAESRGINQASYALPISPRRARQISELKSWFIDWAEAIGHDSSWK